jgi:hypothetical protein
MLTKIVVYSAVTRPISNPIPNPNPNQGSSRYLTQLIDSGDHRLT